MEFPLWDLRKDVNNGHGAQRPPLPGDADRDRLRHQGHAKCLKDPLAHGAGQGLDVGARRTAAVRQGQHVLGGQGRTRRIPGLGQVEALATASRRIGFVKKEPALHVS